MKAYMYYVSGLINKSKYSNYFLVVSFCLALVCFSFMVLHYSGIFYGNDLMWITWLGMTASLFLTFVSRKQIIKFSSAKLDRKVLIIIIITTLVYWTSHLYNFSNAPWNRNGLFDDAAWDIYFAKNHIFNGSPIQPAFFDNVGYISREVAFHYYITLWFVSFGYNLLSFNISLIFLGFITVLFTALIVYELTRDVTIAIISLLIINFFPLHYMHIFMGHRYAIVAPLMTISLYFLYTGFFRKSSIRILVSSLFAYFCWASAIMGKQYLMGILFAAVLCLFWKPKSKDVYAFASLWFVSFILFSLPLITYLLFNLDVYSSRESGLIKEFLFMYKTDGFKGIEVYFHKILEVFFAPHTFLRQFLPDFPAIPLAYYLLLLPGLLIVFIYKRFEILLLSLIPVVGAFFSGAYDFRVLLAVPAWVITIAYFIKFSLNNKKLQTNNYAKKLFVVLLILIVLTGIIPSIFHIWTVVNNPNYLYLLPHKDVAIARITQDIVEGEKNPSTEMKKDELNRKVDYLSVSHDTLACPFSSYAIMHLFLQNYDDKKILSFCNQGIQLLKPEEEILTDNIKAILDYKPTKKDLKLVWEVSDKSTEAITFFQGFGLGESKYYFDVVDGNQISLLVLTIESEDLKEFQYMINTK